MSADATIATPPDDKPGRWHKHFVWIGMAITLVGVFSYFLFTYRFPDLRDFPFLNLPLVVLGIALAGWGCVGVFRRSRFLGKGTAGLAMLLTLATAGLFLFYVFWYSYQLPDSGEAIASDERAPELALPDHNGKTVKLTDYRGKKVVLVFYRGNW